MFDKSTLALALAALFVASTAMAPTAAAEPPSDPRDVQTGNDTLDCIVEHAFNGWFVGNCLSTTQSSGPSETLDCVYEHLKAGWFVGNCLH